MPTSSPEILSLSSSRTVLTILISPVINFYYRHLHYSIPQRLDRVVYCIAPDHQFFHWAGLTRLALTSLALSIRTSPVSELTFCSRDDILLSLFLTVAFNSLISLSNWSTSGNWEPNAVSVGGACVWWNVWRLCSCIGVIICFYLQD